MTAYHVVPVTVRIEQGTVAQAVRVIAAGLRTGSRISLSTSTELPTSVRDWLSASGVGVAVEDQAAWGARAARLAETGGRVRLVGGDVAAVAAATGGSPAVAVYAGPVLTAGRIEMLTFLREQAVSITAHRFGTAHRYEIAPLVG